MALRDQSFPLTVRTVLLPVALTLAIWFVFWFELRFGFNFTHYGVRPRSLSGLRGIIFSPFIHSDIDHLWHNTIPIFVLSLALSYFYRLITFRVIILIALLSGLGTWLIGRDAFHIGMSGVIYGLVSFLFFKGIFAKHYRLIALSLLVVFLYGGIIWGTLPVDPKVSWEGHLSGFLVGIILSLCFRESVPKPPKYTWEKENYNEEDDPFMRHFDADGNFIEFPDAVEDASDYVYHYRSSGKSSEEE